MCTAVSKNNAPEFPGHSGKKVSSKAPFHEGCVVPVSPISLNAPLKTQSIVTLIPSRLTSRILTCTELKGHCLFVLLSGYVCYIKLYTQLSSPR